MLPASAPESQDLAATGVGIVEVGGCLAVHPNVLRGLLDNTVWFRRNDVRVFGQTDVDGLPTAAKGEEQILVGLDARHSDGNRTLEHRHGARKASVMS